MTNLNSLNKSFQEHKFKNNLMWTGENKIGLYHKMIMLQLTTDCYYNITLNWAEELSMCQQILRKIRINLQWETKKNAVGKLLTNQLFNLE